MKVMFHFNMKKIKPINVSELPKYFVYKDGHLHWLKSNKKAGTLRKEGYIVIQYNNSVYYAHRLVWSLLKGAIPDNMQIDHINRDKSDNRIENLRLVNVSQNALNKKFKVSKTGIVGVTKDRAYYKVSFTVNGKAIHVGNFKDIKAAENVAKEYYDKILTDAFLPISEKEAPHESIICS